MIVVDIETTGVDFEKCGIASIGALDFKNPQNQFYLECRVSKDAIITEKALEINGFTREQLYDAGKPDTRTALSNFFSWASNGIEDRTLAGENIGFDINFLEAKAQASCIPWIFGYRSRDLHTTSIDVHERIHVQVPVKDKVSALSLNKTLKFAGLPEEPKPHNGLTGARLEAECFSRLLKGRVLLPEYSIYEIPAYLKKGGV